MPRKSSKAILKEQQPLGDQAAKRAVQRNFRGVWEKNIRGRGKDGKIVDYVAVCDVANCQFKKKKTLRASDMPQDQFAVICFIFLLFVLFCFAGTAKNKNKNTKIKIKKNKTHKTNSVRIVDDTCMIYVLAGRSWRCNLEDGVPYVLDHRIKMPNSGNMSMTFWK